MWWSHQLEFQKNLHTFSHLQKNPKESNYSDYIFLQYSVNVLSLKFDKFNQNRQFRKAVFNACWTKQLKNQDVDINFKFDIFMKINSSL